MTKILLITADWCKFCKAIKKVLEKYIDNGQIEVVEFNNDIAKKYNIRAIPTCIVIKNDSIVKTIPINEIRTQIRKYLI